MSNCKLETFKVLGKPDLCIESHSWVVVEGKRCRILMLQRNLAQNYSWGARIFSEILIQALAMEKEEAMLKAEEKENRNFCYKEETERNH